jgi:hypothetical protein
MLTTKVKGTCVALLAHLLPMASTAVAASMASVASVANSPKSAPWVEVVSSYPTPVIDKATAAKYGTPLSIYSFVEWACTRRMPVRIRSQALRSGHAHCIDCIHFACRMGLMHTAHARSHALRSDHAHCTFTLQACRMGLTHRMNPSIPCGDDAHCSGPICSACRMGLTHRMNPSSHTVMMHTAVGLFAQLVGWASHIA